MLFQLAIFIPLFDFDEVLWRSENGLKDETGTTHTPITKPICTSPGIFLTRPDSSFPDLRPQSIRAFSSVAISSPLKGIRFAFKIVSSLEVAVTMCDEPDVKEVYR
jgi:hypothetical protein